MSHYRTCMFENGQECICDSIKRSLDYWASEQTLYAQRIAGRREGLLVCVGLVTTSFVVVGLIVLIINWIT